MKLFCFSAMLLFSFFFSSCKKNHCANCHYDKAGAEIEIGEKCGSEIESLELNGYSDSTGTYVVYCGH